MQILAASKKDSFFIGTALVVLAICVFSFFIGSAALVENQEMREENHEIKEQNMEMRREIDVLKQFMKKVEESEKY